MKREKKVFDAQMNATVNIKDRSLIHYVGAIPSILLYQIVNKGILGLLVMVLNECIQTLLRNSGIEAISNTDIPFLLKSWQGLIILFIVLFIIVLYAIFDIIGMIIIADNVLHQKNKKLIQILEESILASKYLLHPKALLILIFVSVFAPLSYSFFGISLTESFYIPNFIMSVIQNTPLYYGLFIFCVTGLSIFGFLYLYSFHIMVLRKENISVAMHTSRKMMQKYWWNFFKRYGLFLVKTVLNIGLMALVIAVIPILILVAIYGMAIPRFWLTFMVLHCGFVICLVKYTFVPFQFMELSRILESYTIEDEGEFVAPKHSLHIRFWLLASVVYAGIAGLSFLTIYEEAFDWAFPLYTVSDVVAHRAGGNMANENTMVGLEAAKKAGVYGSEIDIQRTKDGRYIVNHDDTLERLCGVDATSADLTFEECKKLRVADTFNSTGKSVPIATIEEMLDGSKGKIHLFVELKGATADEQMADDLYDMIIERDMVEDVTVISLKYNLIAYLEDKHPEIDTGYLCFVSLGDVSKLKCDRLLLEDEMATDPVIAEAHAAGKKVYIWTVNQNTTMKKRMLDESDGIITDEVRMADELYDQLIKRDDISRAFDIFILYYI